MKMVYAMGMVLAFSGLVFAGETETKMMKEMGKDAMKGMAPAMPAVPAIPAMPGMGKSAVPAVPAMPSLGKSLDAAKDAMKKDVAPHIMPPGMEMDDMAEGMSEEEMLMVDEEMSADEMDEEANLLISEGQMLKKRAAEMRAKEKMKSLAPKK